MTTHDSSGRKQELAIIPLAKLPMWLCSIHASKVSEDLRPKLIRYHCECADVLARHFVGDKTIGPTIGSEDPRRTDKPVLLNVMPTGSTGTRLVSAARDRGKTELTVLSIPGTMVVITSLESSPRGSKSDACPGEMPAASV